MTSIRNTKPGLALQHRREGKRLLLALLPRRPPLLQQKPKMKILRRDHEPLQSSALKLLESKIHDPSTRERLELTLTFYEADRVASLGH
jgi:hypothetical protein